MEHEVVSREFVQNNLFDYINGNVDESTAALVNQGLQAYPDVQKEYESMQRLNIELHDDKQAYSQFMKRRSINIQPKVVGHVQAQKHSLRTAVGIATAVTSVVAAVWLLGEGVLNTTSKHTLVEALPMPRDLVMITEAELGNVLQAEEIDRLSLIESDFTGYIETAVVTDVQQNNLQDEIVETVGEEVLAGSMFSDRLQVEEELLSTFSEQEIQELLVQLDQEFWGGE